MRHELNDLIPTRYSLLSRLKHWDDQASWREFFDTYWRLIYDSASDRLRLPPRHGLVPAVPTKRRL